MLNFWPRTTRLVVDGDDLGPGSCTAYRGDLPVGLDGFD